MQRLLPLAAFAAGLATLAWVAAGQWPAHPGALLVTLLIAVAYLAGARELQRFRRETARLDEVVAALPEDPDAPAPAGDAWLAPLPASLQAVVRARLDGVRGPLPGPAMAPAIAGLLVLLGMLGTFLGLIVTFRGTVLSLEGLTDLAAMRAALAAPVQGLGQAFGASVAGVATSAMLGLMIALARRERAAAGQRLDARIATVLRPLTAAGRQQRIVDALQAQATQLPLLVERMNALADGLVRQGEQLQAGWLAGQQAHHAALERLIGEMNRRTEASVHDLTSRTSASVETLSTRTGAQLEALAGSLQAAVRQHLDDSARALDERQANGLAQTLSTLSRESAAVHERLAAQVGGQVDALAQRLGGATAAIEQRWLDALARHEAQGDAMLGGLREALSGAALAWADRGQALVDALEAREQRRDAALAARTEGLIDGLEARTDRTLSALAGQGEATLSALAQRGEATLSALAAQSETTLRVLSERGAALVQDAGAAQALLAGRVSEELQAVGREVTSVLSRLGAESADLQARQTASMRQLVDTLQQAWGEIDGRQRGLMAHQAAEVERTMAQVVEGFRHEAAALVAAVESAQAQAQAARADGDERRLAAWQAGLETLAASLQSQWQASGEAAAQRQAQAQAQLQATAEALADDHRQRTRATLDEIATLMQAAAQAPRAAAEVVAGLREQLAASVAQDRALLDERGALLEGVRGLLDAAQAASERQGEAVQALVEASRAMLADTGERFAAQVQATAQQLVEAAAGVSGGIAEVAGLGEVFGEAVQRFGDSNAQLGAQLQRIEAALTQSMNRSDDQMAYYVAQARELIDLSLLSQKRIVDELQRGGTGAAAATATREAPDA